MNVTNVDGTYDLRRELAAIRISKDMCVSMYAPDMDQDEVVSEHVLLASAILIDCQEHDFVNQQIETAMQAMEKAQNDQTDEEDGAS